MAFRALRSALRLLPAVDAAVAKSTSGEVSRSFSAISPARRHFHASRPHYALVDVLAKELKLENENESETSALKTPPPGWTLSASNSSTNMKLSKMHDEEKVTIEISTLDQEEMDEGAEEQDGDDFAPATYAINFQVDCEKGTEALRFSMVFMENDTNGPEVEHVGLVPAGQQEDLKQYSGPAFDELDDEAQREFGEYLAERGITAELCQYLCQLVYDLSLIHI